MPTRLAFAAFALLLAGCSAFSHYPDRPEYRHREIQWRPDYTTAQTDAAREDKPILAILIAGGREGTC